MFGDESHKNVLYTKRIYGKSVFPTPVDKNLIWAFNDPEVSFCCQTCLPI